MQIDRKTLVVAVMMVAFTALLRPAAVRAQQAAETAEAREAREVGEAREAREAAGVAISLGEAVRRLESSNPSLHAADWKARSAEREVWEARGELLPTLAASGDYTRYEESNLVTPMHEAPSPKSDPLEFEEEIYTAAAKLTVPLVNLPALSKAQSAKDAARAQAAQRDTLEQRLIASVVEVFVQAQQIDDSLSLIDAYLEALGERREELSE
ncbi:MAG: TolC family protein, partial [Spirochaetia bacterium]